MVLAGTISTLQNKGGQKKVRWMKISFLVVVDQKKRISRVRFEDIWWAYEKIVVSQLMRLISQILKDSNKIFQNVQVLVY